MSEPTIVTQTDALPALAGFPAATVYEALGKRGGMSPDVRPMIRRPRLFGPAYTVRTLGCESAAVLHGIEQAPQGSVLVVDTGGSGASAIWGKLDPCSGHPWSEGPGDQWPHTRSR